MLVLYYVQYFVSDKSNSPFYIDILQHLFFIFLIIIFFFWNLFFFFCRWHCLLGPFEGSLSQGILDNPSALPCLTPGLRFKVYLNSLNRSSQRACCPNNSWAVSM